ncbi:MAG: polysaccharide deacetylase family protein [Lachnospiraceae bacterium]|nr:polysaccharide deacetylase family protein [Lachnospiraceae bacterium]
MESFNLQRGIAITLVMTLLAGGVRTGGTYLPKAVVNHTTTEVTEDNTTEETPADQSNTGETTEETTEDPENDNGEEQPEQPVEKVSLEQPKTFTAVRDNRSITLKWSKVNGAVGYEIYYHIIGKEGYTKLKKLSADKRTYTHKYLTRGKKYRYAIVALDTEEEYNSKRLKTEASIAIPILHPTKVTCENEGFYVKISWKGHDGDVQYEVYRALKKQGTYKRMIKTTKSHYYDKTVKPSTTYYYKVKARNSKKTITFRSDDSAIVKHKSGYLDPKKPLIALTFDDGPSDYTKTVLSSLKKHNAKATFFVVGNRVNANKAVLKQVYSYGCEIGNHSYSHANLGTAGKSEIQSQLAKTDRAVQNVIGVKPTLIRPPYGSTSSLLRSTVDRPLILWSIDTEDWRSRNADMVYAKVIGKVKDGDIVLMHDIYPSTANAATRIITKLSKQGYQMVTVSELALCKKQKLQSGKSYFNIK